MLAKISDTEKNVFGFEKKGLIMDIGEEALNKHYEWKGKIEMIPRASVKNREELAMAYTPGVAAACLEIEKDVNKSYSLTRRWNTVAVVTDGSAVLGLGNIGAEAGMPVMEGKCVLFKEFAGVDAFPICVRSQEVDEIVKTVYNISGGFGGINLEDISAPRCFEIERRLKEICDIPVFHDDQHGTAVVLGAALLNALCLAGKSIENVKIAISGAGSAGIAAAEHLMRLGAKNIVVCASGGIICEEDESINPSQRKLAKIINRENIRGSLADALKDADAFVGLSRGGIVSEEMICSMADKPIVFPLANPEPEIMPDKARAAGAYIVGTGRSDFDNQINNVLAFPGIFRGALDARAEDINEEMLLAATYKLAESARDRLCEKYILPEVFDKDVGKSVAEAVKNAAIKSGAARI